MGKLRRVVIAVGFVSLLALVAAACNTYPYVPPVSDPGTTATTIAPTTTTTVPPPLGFNELITQSTGGQLASFTPWNSSNGIHPSRPVSISADGNYVAFESSATNLVSGDTNFATDVFVRDRVTRMTERVDVTNSGSELISGGENASVSDSGRFVSFSTDSPELAPGGEGHDRVYVRDRTAHTTTLVGILPDGTTPGFAIASGISSDGRYVPFIVNPDGAKPDLYLRDLVAHTTRLIDTSLSGWDWTPMTDNGQIAFVSSSSTLVPGDTNGYPDVFVETLSSGAIERVNLTPSGVQESGSATNSARVAISRDGRFVVFWSASANMGVQLPGSAVFIRDRVAGTTERASVLPFSYPYCFSQNEGVSNDGRFVSFSVMCEDDTTQYVANTMVRDRQLGTTTQIDAVPDLTTPFFCCDSVMSANGQWVAYQSLTTDLTPGDTNNQPDVFIRKVN